MSAGLSMLEIRSDCRLSSSAVCGVGFCSLIANTYPTRERFSCIAEFAPCLRAAAEGVIIVFLVPLESFELYKLNK